MWCLESIGRSQRGGVGFRELTWACFPGAVMPFLRPRVLLRPRLPVTSQTHRTTYTSLARPPLRPLSSATRVFLHPAAFLVHLTGITLGSILVSSHSPISSSAIPLQKSATEGAALSDEEKELEAEDADDYDQPTSSEPIPSPRQLHSLASLLYSQILQSPLSAQFTLRQLHMLRPPPFHLPELVEDHEFVPEPWLWHLPAGAAIQAFLETKGEAKEKLLPLVVQLAENALHWDTALWHKVLSRARLPRREVKDDLSRGLGTLGKGLAEPVPPVLATKPSPLQWRSYPTPITDLLPPLPQMPLEVLPPSQHPLSSIPIETLEGLIRTLLGDRANTVAVSVGLSLSFSLGTLSQPRSLGVVRETTTVSLLRGRVDLAARTWAQWISSSPGSSRVAERALARIAKAMRESPGDPSLNVLSAFDKLARTLSQHWGSNGLGRSMGGVVKILSRLPPPPFETDFPGDVERRSRIKKHKVVYATTRGVLLTIIQDLVARRLAVNGHGDPFGPNTRIVVGEYSTPTERQAAERKAKARAHGLTVPHFNILIHYALKHLDSPDLALRLFGALQDAGLEPSAVTHNILLPLYPTAAEIFKSIRSRTENAHTLPPFFESLRTPADFAILPRLVFAIFPEIDRTPPTLPLDSTAPPVPTVPTPPAPPAATPPPPGRSPQLYLAVLSALTHAGQTGLAERVFRLTRWAAERSRSPLPSPIPSEKPWRVPPRAFALMLNLYAAEARRGLSLARRGDTRQWRRGWGRQAMRAFWAAERKEALSAQLGGDVEVRGRRAGEGSGMVRRVGRFEAARIAARYELEGGSSRLELESLRVALEGGMARRAVGLLFEKTGGQRVRLGRRERREKERVVEMERDPRRQRRRLWRVVRRAKAHSAAREERIGRYRALRERDREGAELEGSRDGGVLSGAP